MYKKSEMQVQHWHSTAFTHLNTYSPFCPLSKMSGKFVLITGVTGYIGGQVVESFLQAGYRVRGTVRGAKINQLTATNGLEFVQIDDIADADFTEALKGVDAVVHTACNIAGGASAEKMLATSIDGTMNLLRQAEKHGIKNFVVTGSCANCVDYTTPLSTSFVGANISEKDWGIGTRESALARSEDTIYVYAVAKMLAEKAVWEFAKTHPHVKVAAILPGLVYGPFSSRFPSPTSVGALSTMGLPFCLLNGIVPTMVVAPWVTDVRDVGKAHVLALELPKLEPSADVEARRFLLCGGSYTWKEASADLKAALPKELGEKITDRADLPDLPGPPSTLDAARARDVLGLEFIPPRKTIQDAIISLVEIQKAWK
ncbi:NAD(P)-binding protein [Coprinopsis marcescibilis]|uniref:NAD(P)-binding protein n=1 Tax=Coprinopsis marcescibilis TaxID=230819 RepID=A0A5C3L2I1_COPMA|nr:NAD(P)-binding protein [Coprinopsis marcescibilis]